MNAKERAEQFVQSCFFPLNDIWMVYSRDRVKEKFTAELEAYAAEKVDQAENEKGEAIQRAFDDGHSQGKIIAFYEAAKTANEEWKKHRSPQLKDPSENAELTALRIRDAIRARAAEADK